MRWGMPAFFLIAIASLAGCNSTRTFKAVMPSKRITSIVSLSPSTTEILGTTNVSMLLKGRTASDDYPASVKSTPIVASLKPDYEAIKLMNPTLILYDAQLYSPEDIAKIKAMNVDTFVVDAENIADFEKELFQLGDMVMAQTSMSDYVDRIEVARNSARGSKPAKPLKVAVLMPGRGGPALISGTKSFLNDVITQAGGTMVGPAVENFVPVNAETLVSQNPDLIVIPSETATAAADAASILQNPQFKTISAVQNKRIAALDSEVVLRRGARVDKLLLNMSRAFTIGAKP
jgi:iron complex transport system substrate-binding protein